jgi:thiol-disulfide isomerase/thioredoxin
MSSHGRMIPLPSQEFFESLIKKNPPKPHDPIVIIKFGATWCGPCKRLDMDFLTGLSEHIKWYECDVDENDYTPGYCGVKGIPAFLAIVNGQAQPLYVQSDTMKVAQWIKNGFKA